MREKVAKRSGACGGAKPVLAGEIAWLCASSDCERADDIPGHDRTAARERRRRLENAELQLRKALRKAPEHRSDHQMPKSVDGPPGDAVHSLSTVPAALDRLLGGGVMPMERAGVRPARWRHRWAGLPGRISLWRPPFEAVVGGVALLTIGFFGLLSRHLPGGLVLKPTNFVTLAQNAQQAQLRVQAQPRAARKVASEGGQNVQPISARPTQTAQPNTGQLTEARPIAAQGRGIAPARSASARAVAASMPPARVPVNVSVLYHLTSADAGRRARSYADALQREGIAATPVATKIVRIPVVEIGYYYGEDLPQARALSARLGMVAGVVHALHARANRPHAPGSLEIRLP